MLLSILVPTIKRHDKYLQLLLIELRTQIQSYEVEILIDDNETDNIGAKRNRLLESAKGEYVAFFDADDYCSMDYIEQLMKAVESGCDCGSLKGSYSVNGVFDGIFEHSIKYNEWRTTGNEIKYERFPNHLNLIKSSIAKNFKFPEKNYGEDYDWSTLVHESGLLKTEYYIENVIYFYRFNSKK